jgi:Kef-type K+ transport system membrane component KefB
LSQTTNDIPQRALPARGVGIGAVALHGGMVVGAVGLFLLIDRFGATLSAPEASAAAPVASGVVAAVPQADPVVHVLIALTAVLVAGRIVAALFRFIGQPPVIGEVVGGILLGPSFLGRVWPDAGEFILPPSVAPSLGMIAQLGVILYMFLVGLELNPSVLRARAHATVAISHASILAPFVLGSGLALFRYPRLSSSDVKFTSFALFMGVAMSITAFPVLARILTDRRMQTTPLGLVALGCAATDDVTAFCLLAFVVGVAQAKVGGAFVVLGLTLAYIGFMFIIVRPLARRILAGIDESRLTPNVVAGVFAALLASALITEWIGIRAIFGAFLLGAVIPHDSVVATAFTDKLVDLVTILLLPAFFAFTGM